MFEWWKRLWQQAPAKSSSLGFRHVDWPEAESKMQMYEVMVKGKEQVNLKQALIQADTLVDGILKQTSLSGQTMGERLKSLRGKIPNQLYRDLWQAHLKRNKLVHEAGSFVADWESQKYMETYRQVIDQFKRMR